MEVSAVIHMSAPKESPWHLIRAVVDTGPPWVSLCGVAVGVAVAGPSKVPVERRWTAHTTAAMLARQPESFCKQCCRVLRGLEPLRVVK